MSSVHNTKDSFSLSARWAGGQWGGKLGRKVGKVLFHNVVINVIKGE